MNTNVLNYGYFRLARNAMLNSDFDKRYRMGCVIVKHKPISFGFNQMKTNPNYPNLYSVHAELKAILHSETDIEGSIMWVYREMADGYPAMAKPCNTCAMAIIEAGIKKVYFSIKGWPYYSSMEVN